MGIGLMDAGHGGQDSGAVGGGRLEKNDVLLVALKTREILQSQGETIDMTRTTDATVSLQARVDMEHKKKYDYYVSFHRNSDGGIGVETFCYKFSCANAKRLATLVHQEMCNAGLVNANRGVKEGDFKVIRETNTDAILVEMGFIDNAKDNELFANRYNDYALAIAKGILAFVGKKYVAPQPPAPAKPAVQYGTVTADVLNVRNKPNGDIIGKLKQGDKVKLDKLTNGWWSIYFGDHGGFVSAQFIK